MKRKKKSNVDAIREASGELGDHDPAICPSCASGYPFRLAGFSTPPVTTTWASMQVQKGPIRYHATPDKPSEQAEPLPVEQSTEPIVAFRAWRLRYRYPDGPVLHSLNSGNVGTSVGGRYYEAGGERWEPMQRMEARCPHSMRLDAMARFAVGMGLHAEMVAAMSEMTEPAEKHDVPSVGCSCGIYAHTDHVDVQPGETVVVGEVYLWGRVIVCERGYRSQFAYPKRLAVVGASQHIAGALEASYGVPCESWN